MMLSILILLILSFMSFMWCCVGFIWWHSFSDVREDLKRWEAELAQRRKDLNRRKEALK